MRTPVVVLGLSLAACALACGPSKKPAEDPSASSSSGGDENKKWEEATPEDQRGSSPKSSSSGGSGGSSGSSGGAASGSSGGAPAPSSPPSKRHDEYDKEATEVVLRRAANQVKGNCGAARDDDGKQTGPWGKTKVSLTLGRNGRMKGVQLPSNYENKAAGRCIVNAFQGLIFPPWSGQDATIDWDIELVQPPPPEKPEKK